MAFHTLSFYFKVIEFFLKKAEKDGNLNTTAAFFFFLSKLDKKILLKKDLSFLHIPEVESR